MSTEPLKGPDAISVYELADMQSARKAHTVLDVREARELDVCRLEGALHIRWRRSRHAPTTSRRISCWW
jgi:rhodanese-related sulfurtransferase